MYGPEVWRAASGVEWSHWGLWIGLDLMERCDDSYSALGDVIGEALEAYAGTDWRSTGVAPTVFWPDFLETACASAAPASPGS
jgi:hypothetical protein